MRPGKGIAVPPPGQLVAAAAGRIFRIVAVDVGGRWSGASVPARGRQRRAVRA